jgi:glycyl-tRNA synthetase
MDQTIFEKIVALCKRRGFIYPGSEIYGGLANTYDYGPMGAELLRNIKNLWWENFIHQREDVVGLDASIISSHRIWDASGHTSGFSDAMIDCKNCKSRFRADHIIEDYFENKNSSQKVEGLSEKELSEIIKTEKIPCPKCGKHDWTEVRKFNLLFPVQLGIVEGDQSLAYLRGETAQGIFTNFRNVVDSTRV